MPTIAGRHHILRQPTEIIDHIMSYLYDDRKSLLACSLAHSILLPSATKILLGTRLHVSPLIFSGLLPALIAPSVNLREGLCCITTLILDATEQPNTIFRCCDWNHAMSSFQTLRYLKLFCVDFGEFGNFVDLVCGFPALEALSLSGVMWERTGGTSPVGGYRRINRPFCIPSLDLNEKNAVDLIQWILAHDEFPPIDVLYIDAYTHKPEDKGLFRQFVGKCKESIRELKIEVLCADYERSDTNDFLGLSLYNNLRRLHLHNIVLFGGVPLVAPIPLRIPLLLSKLTSTPLEEIVFTVLIRYSRDLDLLDWNIINEHLSIARFPTLKAVHVRVSGLEGTTSHVLVAHSLRERKLFQAQLDGILTLEFIGERAAASEGENQ
ncbi:hypothetical protein BDQ12DRAFT_8022 [Crucibulum laeve]|uniref:F-box domain-containing protein n=1 Tax=Crucibulum laeve TaxID=68775 RepID=A0A5C3MHV6_9AGAR|nr:hypothetical protein BDQ12DRAFT_8022 [Crucibulum laeve]